MSYRVPTALILSAALLAGTAFAAGHGSPEDIHKTRNDGMKAIGMNMGILGKMVKGETDFDAAAAGAAATELVSLTAETGAAWWVDGTSSDDVATSRLKPGVDLADVQAKHQALADAAVAVQAAAAQGLDPMKGAFGALGATCGDCHKVYRGPKP